MTKIAEAIDNHKGEVPPGSRSNMIRLCQRNGIKTVEELSNRLSIGIDHVFELFDGKTAHDVASLATGILLSRGFDHDHFVLQTQ